ncbi:MAG: tetratricopeptide repeat protein [Anaerolineae bacterium]
MLQALAAEQPLLLVVDDLQWADAGSIELLFRLGRRIGESCILIVGTYRPEDVALGRRGERHPLEPVVNEFKRYLGDMVVHLGQADEAAGRQFIDAFLDTTPNRLGEDFRQALFQHTRGHPLFTVELLRDLQERGDLVQDQTGRWVAQPALAWDALPARVEGVIAQRIGRLAAELQEALTVASVEGEDFTAEVVARVQALDERGLVRRLSRELDKQHRLVRAQGRQRIGRQRLSLYRFQHNLFQKYLYNNLDEVERSLLHEDVGLMLEALYGEQAEEIAVQLARHFLEAGLDDKALGYSILAGDRARKSFANEEALAHYDQALALCDRLAAEEKDPQAVQENLARRFDILRAQGLILGQLGRRPAEGHTFEALIQAATQLGDDTRLIEARTYYAGHLADTGDFVVCVQMAQQTLELALQAGDRKGQAWSWAKMAYGHFRMGQYEKAVDLFQTALDIVRQLGDPGLEEAYTNWLGNSSIILGDYEAGLSHYRQALQLMRERGGRRAEGMYLGNIAFALWHVGEYARALDYAEQALDIARKVGDRNEEARAHINIGRALYHLDRLEAAERRLRTAATLSRQVGQPYLLANALNYLAMVLLAGGEPERLTEAAALADEAVTLARELHLIHAEIYGLSLQGLTSLKIGDEALALERSSHAVALLEEQGRIEGAEEEIFFNHACILRAAGQNKAADHYLAKAHQEMVAKAEKIEDKALQQTFLTRVEVNRQIMAAVRP